jgi:hypothetical protein
MTALSRRSLLRGSEPWRGAKRGACGRKTDCVAATTDARATPKLVASAREDGSFVPGPRTPDKAADLTSSQETRRWREQDSNPRSLGCCAQREHQGIRGCPRQSRW